MAGKAPTAGQIAIFWGVFQTLVLIVQFATGVEIDCKCNDPKDEPDTDADA